MSVQTHAKTAPTKMELQMLFYGLHLCLICIVNINLGFQQSHYASRWIKQILKNSPPVVGHLGLHYSNVTMLKAKSFINE